MKQTLSQEARRAVVDYRREKALESIKDAEILAQNERFDADVNRLYYACYYMASALLIANEIEAQSHAGIKRMFSFHFVKPGKIDIKYFRFFSDLMNGRQLSDYEDFIFQDRESYNKYKSQADEFISTLDKLI